MKKVPLSNPYSHVNELVQMVFSLIMQNKSLDGFERLNIKEEYFKLEVSTTQNRNILHDSK